ncbi:MAG: hypothetical protein ABIW76_08025 [Fibrobacteria bacterium]
MSSTDSRTVDPAQPHHSENGGHEMSDFSWTTVLWLLPISVVVLLAFFAVCISWFLGAKDRELEEKQSMFIATELNQLHAKESEILASYKIIDKATGRYQIPIARAMELIAQEHQNVPGKEWKPITDTYLEGAPFKSQKLVNETESPEVGISIEETSAEKPAHVVKPEPALKGDGKDKTGTAKPVHEKAH